MNKVFVAVFNNELEAFEGVNALRELHATGNISLYETAVLVKDGTGTITVKQVDKKTPARLAPGSLSDGLIGLLGRPVTVPVVAAVGTLTGLLFDLFRSAISVAFVDDVSRALTTGKAAVIADMTSRTN